jgi:hypothetical protein
MAYYRPKFFKVIRGEENQFRLVKPKVFQIQENWQGHIYIKTVALVIGLSDYTVSLFKYPCCSAISRWVASLPEDADVFDYIVTVKPTASPAKFGVQVKMNYNPTEKYGDIDLGTRKIFASEDYVSYWKKRLNPEVF